MKSLIQFLVGIAVAATCFVGCSNSYEDIESAIGSNFTLTLVTDGLSRTEYDPDLCDIKWSEGDLAQVLVKGTYADATASVDRNEPRIASFKWAPGSYISYVSAGTHTVQGYYPRRAYLSCSYNASGTKRTHATRLGLRLPASQSGTTTTFDPLADILVADNMEVEITRADISAANKVVNNFHFRRMVAISEFEYKISNSELLNSDEKVQSVAFQVVSPANDKYIAGNMYIQPTADGAKYVDANINAISNSNDYFYGEDSNTVTVTLTDQPTLKSGFTAWFVTSPVTLAVGDKVVFTITTTAGTTITKSVNISSSVTLSTTKKNTLTVNLDNSVEIKSPTTQTPDPDTPSGGDGEAALGLSWLEIPAAMRGSEMGGVTTSALFMHTFYYGAENASNRNYTVCYDKGKMTTYWVAYPLNSSHIGSLDRTDVWTYVDNSLLATEYQPNIVSGSYRSAASGGTNNYSRGHLLPSASRTATSLMNEQTFITVNQVPQIQDGFNGGVWMYLESAVRSARNGKTIFVVTGTALQKGNGEAEEIGTMAKTYDRNGKEIPVPRYFYKVLLKVDSETNPTTASAVGFWFTNQSSSSGYESFAVSVDQIESKLGMDFFVNLPDALEQAVEKNTSWSTFSIF
ncbi:MAG: DNA/RNA non-specific endonuclease [Alistipes sp.]|nr:DNA/RNA non-specific endonuclease [Alistipes sp.]